MSRDPKRIEKVIDKIRQFWYMYPDLRLGQILTNVVPRGVDLFYVEEDYLIKYIDDYIETIKSSYIKSGS